MYPYSLSDQWKYTKLVYESLLRVTDAFSIRDQCKYTKLVYESLLMVTGTLTL